MSKSKNIKIDLYISWSILVLFYLYQYVLRNAPGVLIEEIREQYNINADQFALMGSMYYYGYSLMQIPLGLVIDRIGIRKTALWSILLCIFGTFLLTTTHIPLVGYISRLIVGIGAASAFMGSLKLASDHLPPEKKGFLIGATLTFGAIGALITGTPLNYLLHSYDWQTSFLIFACAGIAIWLLAFLYLPKNRKQPNIHEFEPSNISQDLLAIISNKKILLYAFIAIGLYTPLAVMADLWGTAFMVKRFNLTREIASPILMNIYIGMAIGSIALPYFAEKYHILDKIIKFSAVVLLMLFSILIYSTSLNQSSIIILLMLIGFFCGAEMLCFTAALRYTNPHTSGLTIGVVNTLNMLSGALMQQVIGFYLDLTWQGQLDHRGLRIYSVQEFVEAFTILVIIIGICAVTAFLALGNKSPLLVKIKQ